MKSYLNFASFFKLSNLKLTDFCDDPIGDARYDNDPDLFLFPSKIDPTFCDLVFEGNCNTGTELVFFKIFFVNGEIS